LVGARPFGGSASDERKIKKGKKGADKTIDGIIIFLDATSPKKTKRAIVQVKSGKNISTLPN
jgi:hypothetical protein